MFAVAARFAFRLTGFNGNQFRVVAPGAAKREIDGGIGDRVSEGGIAALAAQLASSNVAATQSGNAAMAAAQTSSRRSSSAGISTAASAEPRRTRGIAVRDRPARRLSAPMHDPRGRAGSSSAPGAPRLRRALLDHAGFGKQRAEWPEPALHRFGESAGLFVPCQGLAFGHQLPQVVGLWSALIQDRT